MQVPNPLFSKDLEHLKRIARYKFKSLLEPLVITLKPYHTVSSRQSGLGSYFWADCHINGRGVFEVRHSWSWRFRTIIIGYSAQHSVWYEEKYSGRPTYIQRNSSSRRSISMISTMRNFLYHDEAIHAVGQQADNYGIHIINDNLSSRLLKTLCWPPKLRSGAGYLNHICPQESNLLTPLFKAY
jgi:hypothetical protein